MRVTDYADAGSVYLYHCHILQHDDLGMMGQYVVIPTRSGSRRNRPVSVSRLDVTSRTPSASPRIRRDRRTVSSARRNP